MTKTTTIPFAELSVYLQQLGFHRKGADDATVFEHPEQGLLVFRRYRDGERVDPRDLVSARKFLDMRGVLNAADFDSFLDRAATSA